MGAQSARLGHASTPRVVRRRGSTATLVRSHAEKVQELRECDLRIQTTSHRLDDALDDYAQQVRSEAREIASGLVAEYERHLGSFGTGLQDWESLISAPPQQASLPRAVRLGLRLEESGLGQISIPRIWSLGEEPKPLAIHAARGDDRDALRLLQSLLLRLGLHFGTMARYSCVDPVGLGSAFPFAGKLPSRSPATPAELLRAVVTDIEAIYREQLSSERPSLLSRAPQKEGVVEVVAIHLYPEGLTNADQQLVEKIATHGPRAGKILLLNVAPQQSIPKQLKDACQRINVPGDSGWLPDQVPLAEHETRITEAISSITPKRPALDWKTTVGLPPEQWWRESSVDVISTPIGEGANGGSRVLARRTEKWPTVRPRRARGPDRDGKVHALPHDHLGDSASVTRRLSSNWF